MWIVSEVGNVNSASMNDGLEYEDDNVNVENGGKMALWMTLAMKQRESLSARGLSSEACH